jgi:hypothetical protein
LIYVQEDIRKETERGFSNAIKKQVGGALTTGTAQQDLDEWHFVEQPQKHSYQQLW